MFRIFATEEFEKDYRRLDTSEQIRITKIIEQLRQQGDAVGKPFGASIFKEKKFDGKRVYFLVYKELSTILIVALGDKKAQQATINAILSELSGYQRYINETLKKGGLL